MSPVTSCDRISPLYMQIITFINCVRDDQMMLLPSLIIQMCLIMCLCVTAQGREREKGLEKESRVSLDWMNQCAVCSSAMKNGRAYFWETQSLCWGHCWHGSTNKSTYSHREEFKWNVWETVAGQRTSELSLTLVCPQGTNKIDLNVNLNQAVLHMRPRMYSCSHSIMNVDTCVPHHLRMWSEWTFRHVT